MFDDFYLSAAGVGTLVALIAVMALVTLAVNLVPKLVHRWEIEYTTRDITYGAVCLAMSYALSWASMFKMPQGGSVTPAALAPLFIYCYYFGFRKGAVLAAAYTLLQFTQGAYVVSPWSAFFDYILPYYAVSIVGLFRFRPEKYAEFVRRGEGEKRSGVRYVARTLGGHGGMLLGMTIHAAVRYLSCSFSGLLFFADAEVGLAANLAYTFTYNTVVLVDSAVAVAAVVMLLSSRAFNGFMTASFTGKRTLAAAYEGEGAPDGPGEERA